MVETFHEPLFKADRVRDRHGGAERRASRSPGSSRRAAEPIRNPVTGNPHRAKVVAAARLRIFRGGICERHDARRPARSKLDWSGRHAHFADAASRAERHHPLSGARRSTLEALLKRDRLVVLASLVACSPSPGSISSISPPEMASMDGHVPDGHAGHGGHAGHERRRRQPRRGCLARVRPARR